MPEDVDAGDEIMGPVNGGGQVAAISWLMVCDGQDYPDDDYPDDDYAS